MDKGARDRFLEVVEELKGCEGIVRKREKLLELGFEFFDDEGNPEDSEDILQELVAEPEAERQRKLVAFFEGNDEPSEEILECFLAEKHSNDTNYPLIWRYFRQGNGQLKKMVVYALEQNPWHESFLRDLSSLNEYDLNLKELIRFYTVACRGSPSEAIFRDVAKNFHESTQPCGFDAFHELMQDEMINDGKKAIVTELRNFYDELEKSVNF